MGERILEVRNLCTSFFTHEGEVKAVNDVSFHIDEQEIVAFVGESGCGKTSHSCLCCGSCRRLRQITSGGSSLKAGICCSISPIHRKCVQCGAPVSP